MPETVPNPAPSPVPAPAVTAAQPEKLFAGKYKTVEELEQGYVEAQKVIGRKSELPTIDAAPASPFSDDNFGVSEALTKMGKSETEIAEAIAANNGKVPDDLYKLAKEKAGVPRKLFDDVVAQRATLAQAELTKAKTQAVGIAGGQQQLDTLYAFAKGLPADAIARLNTLLGNTATHADGVRLLKTYHAEAVNGGSTTALIEGSAGAARGNASAYANQREFMAGYQAGKTDPAARARHDARKAVSPAVTSLPL